MLAHRQACPPRPRRASSGQLPGGEWPGESPSLRKPWRFNLYLYLGHVLARVCESFADWSHGKVQSMAAVCPDAITVVLRVAGT
jgi:hypothetical protein